MTSRRNVVQTAGLTRWGKGGGDRRATPIEDKRQPPSPATPPTNEHANGSQMVNRITGHLMVARNIVDQTVGGWVGRA